MITPPIDFWCDNCSKWRLVETDDEGPTSENPKCEECGEYFHCQECGYVIDLMGFCQRFEGHGGNEHDEAACQAFGASLATEGY